MRELSPNGARQEAKKSSPTPDPVAAAKEVAAYGYQDPTGRVRFESVRYEPKTFKQCKIVDGTRVWNMDGVERLPYRLPEIIAAGATEVWIVEGEKDVESLRAAGQTATCNPGGPASGSPLLANISRTNAFISCPTAIRPAKTTLAASCNRSPALCGG